MAKRGMTRSEFSNLQFLLIHFPAENCAVTVHLQFYTGMPSGAWILRTKRERESPLFFCLTATSKEALRRRLHNEQDTCCVCLDSKERITYCNRCSATVCYFCALHIASGNDGLYTCPLCRLSFRFSASGSPARALREMLWKLLHEEAVNEIRRCRLQSLYVDAKIQYQILTASPSFDLTVQRNSPKHTKLGYIPTRFHAKVIRVYKKNNEICLAPKMSHHNVQAYQSISHDLIAVAGWRVYTDVQYDLTCCESHSVVREESSGKHFCVTYDDPDVDFWFIPDSTAPGKTDRWLSGRRHPHFEELKLGSAVDTDRERWVRSKIAESVRRLR